MEDLLRHLRALHLRLLGQDRDAGLQVRGLEVGDQAPLEARAEPVVHDLQLLGRTVARNHHLSAGLVERVEDLEELRLRALLCGDELYVVHEPDVDRPVLLAEGAEAVVTNRRDHVIGEGVTGNVLDAQGAVATRRLVPDRLHEVGLSQAHAAVEEEGIIGLGRRSSHGQCRRVREPVALAHHEVL